MKNVGYVKYLLYVKISVYITDTNAIRINIIEIYNFSQILI